MIETVDVRVYACPACRGELGATHRRLRCNRCGRVYPFIGEIPDFLTGTADGLPSVVRQVDWFDRLAPVYETRWWSSFVCTLLSAKGCDSLPRLVSAVERIITSANGLILDVASGPGTYGRRVANQQRRVYAMDISGGMLNRGLTFARREGVTNIRFARARVEALPFADAVFDAAICGGSLHLFQDPLLALRQIARTLRPAAPLACITFAAGPAGILKYARIRRYLSRRKIVCALDTHALEGMLDEAGFGDYRPTAYGSLLVFSARRAARQI